MTTIEEAATELQRGRALPVALFKELMRDLLFAVLEEACGLERDICEDYNKQSMVHARHFDLRRQIEGLK